MKIRIGTILLILIISLSALMGFRQYQRDESAKKSTESEPQTEISWNTPYGKATMKKVADLDESGNPIYDTSKNYYKDYDDTGLETCKLTGIFADSEEEAVREIREAGKCKYAYLTKEGNSIILELTDEQRIWWIETAKDRLKNISDENDEMVSMDVSDNYKTLNIVADRDGDSDKFDGNMASCIYAMEIIQMFSGADEWSVNIIVTNARNGKEIVNVDFPREKLTIDPEMWEE